MQRTFRLYESCKRVTGQEEGAGCLGIPAQPDNIDCVKGTNCLIGASFDYCYGVTRRNKREVKCIKDQYDPQLDNAIVNPPKIRIRLAVDTRYFG